MVALRFQWLTLMLSIMIKACPDVILKFITKTINNRILLLVCNIVIASRWIRLTVGLLTPSIVCKHVHENVL